MATGYETYGDKQHLPSLLNVVTGAWLVIAPFLLGYAFYAPARNNDIVVGILVALLAAGRAFGHTGAWAAWANVALGAWLVMSPYMLRFANHGVSGNNDVVVGLVVIGFALWSAFAQPMNEQGGLMEFSASEPSSDELLEREIDEAPPADDRVR